MAIEREDRAALPSEPAREPGALDPPPTAGHQRAADLEARHAALARALARDPCNSQVLYGLGGVLQAQGKPAAAMVCFERAAHLNPNDAAVRANLGLALRTMGRLRAALATLEQAVTLAPEAPLFQHGLGVVLRDLGRHSEALACFDHALKLRPGDAQVEVERAYTCLAAGDYRAGFKALAARDEATAPDALTPQLPRWTGETLEGQTLLVRAEPRREDTILLSRYLPLIGSNGGRVVLACDAGMRDLLADTRGVDGVGDDAALRPSADLETPLIALPKVLRTTRHSVPAAVPYLKAPAEAGFTLTHPDSAKLSVGLLWKPRESPYLAGVALPDLTCYLPLIQRAEVAVYSLEHEGSAELSRLGASGLIHDLGQPLTALVDIARVMEQLDLIVTSDTLAAQLAGALGRAVWLILPEIADWRWANQEDRTRWYPTMRLFRRKANEDWPAVFRRVERKLTALVAA